MYEATAENDILRKRLAPLVWVGLWWLAVRLEELMQVENLKGGDLKSKHVKQSEKGYLCSSQMLRSSTSHLH